TGPTRRGTRGDVVLRSTVRYLKTCEAALQTHEEAFGMTPLSRMRLGITYSEGRSAVERLREPAKPTPMPEPDPRRLLYKDRGGGMKKSLAPWARCEGSHWTHTRPHISVRFRGRFRWEAEGQARSPNG